MPQQDPLANLHPMHLPQPVSWWPPAPGWWLLAALLLIITVTALYLVRHYHRRAVARRQALRELKQLEVLQRDGEALEYLRRLNLLLKRVVHHYYPPRYSSLTGDAWLDFLRQSGGHRGFDHAELLGHALYRPDAPDPGALNQLHQQARQWLRQQPRRLPC